MTSICTACEHRVNGITKQCPMCGGSMKIQTHANVHGYDATDSQVRSCPRCQIPLKINQFNQYQLDSCQQCKGVWLEPEKFQLLTSEFDVYRDPNADPVYQRQSMPKAEGYLPCAHCQKLMTRHNFKAISGVIIDTCNRCGVWLDHQELEQIRSFVASGGLDKAQDRKIAKQASELEALDDRVSDVELMNKLLHKWNYKRIFFDKF